MKRCRDIVYIVDSWATFILNAVQESMRRRISNTESGCLLMRIHGAPGCHVFELLCKQKRRCLEGVIMGVIGVVEHLADRHVVELELMDRCGRRRGQEARSCRGTQAELDGSWCWQ